MFRFARRRQMPDQFAHVSQCLERNHAGDDQRPRQWPRPIGALKRHETVPAKVRRISHTLCKGNIGLSTANLGTGNSVRRCLAVMDRLKPNRPRANPADPEIVRELIAVARKERASLHSLVALLGDQISHCQELIRHLHSLIVRLDEVLLQLEEHQPSCLVKSIRRTQASACVGEPNGFRQLGD